MMIDVNTICLRMSISAIFTKTILSRNWNGWKDFKKNSYNGEMKNKNTVSSFPFLHKL